MEGGDERKWRGGEGRRGGKWRRVELEEGRDSDRKMGDLWIATGGSDGDRSGDHPPIEEPEVEGVLGDSKGGLGLSTYLVACHGDWSMSSKPYSVYKVVGGMKKLKRLVSLTTGGGGKTFTTVRSSHRSWIVGVGGNSSDTIIFNTKSQSKEQAVIKGPNLMSAKWCPILTAVGDKVYAFCKVPSWNSDPDFPPWFEVLDLSRARVVTDGDVQQLDECSWSELPNPPCVPWKLTPTEYTWLPITIVTSHVVVAHYILVSFSQEWGTYALDTSSHKWHKVHDKRLPFVGGAFPHGSFFLALSKQKGPIKAYCINLATSVKFDAIELSITELPVKYEGHEVYAEPCFSSLDNGRFCSPSLSEDSNSVALHFKNLELYPIKARLNLRTYQIEPSLLATPEETLLAVKPEVAISNQLEQAFKMTSSSHGFSVSAFTLLSV